MIGVRLRGGLGNQMFQYAAARTLAERLGCLLVTSDYGLGAGLVAAAHRLGLRRRPPAGGVQPSGLLRAALECAPQYQQGRVLEIAAPAEARLAFRRRFSPRTFSLGKRYECFDQALLRQKSGTWLRGFYQSEKYFAGNAEHVRRWFTPRLDHRTALEQAMARLPAAPENMIAIHVRRGDYLGMRNALADPDMGWALPARYYRRALEHAPSGARLAVFTDDPDWAAREFADRRPWISRGNSAVVDMFLMARCRWIVTANSTFSWWSGWLGQHVEKVVVAPRYHLGWRVGQWVPEGIEVAGWRYLSTVE